MPERPDDQLVLPFSWSGVRVDPANGATTLRVRISPTGQDTYALELADGLGAVVASVEALVARPVSAESLNRGPESLYRLDWVAATAAPTGPAGTWAVIGQGRGRAFRRHEPDRRARRGRGRPRGRCAAGHR